MTAAHDAFERWAYGEGFTAGEVDGRKRGFDEGYAAGFDAGVQAGATRALLALEWVPGAANCVSPEVRTACDGTAGGRR
jgi:hypothetical protein